MILETIVKVEIHSDAYDNFDIISDSEGEFIKIVDIWLNLAEVKEAIKIFEGLNIKK